MSKILGLDLGTNSIGWAIVENEKLQDSGVLIFLAKIECQLVRFNYFKKTIDCLLLKANQILLILGLFFSLALLNLKNWLFWLGLAVASILTFLSGLFGDKNDSR
nr:hypothetical protein [uncultured Draconibacterium sp.]